MHLMDFTFRIVMSIVLGFFIGAERQLTGHPAGIRTNVLVSLGSSIFVLFSIIVHAPDLTRIAAQIVTGVGFLGSGIIFKDGLTVRGLNTAATIWCTAAIGVLVSSGKIEFALIATVLVVLSNIIFRLITNIITPLVQFDETEKYYRLSITCEEAKDIKVRTIIMSDISNSSLVLTTLESSNIIGDKVEIVARLLCHGRRKDEIVEELVRKLSKEEHTISAGWELYQ